jgi:hypothetical protein
VERTRSWPRRAVRRLGSASLLVLAMYLVARAVVEVASVNPTRPNTYRHDWGGPHYLGVLLVHVGPGAVAIALAARHLPSARANRRLRRTE